MSTIIVVKLTCNKPKQTKEKAKIKMISIDRNAVVTRFHHISTVKSAHII